MIDRHKIIEEYGTAVRLDIIKHFLGDLVSRGTARDVFVFNDEYVLKVENKERSFQNVNEHRVWEEVKNTKWSKWFAPIQNISPCGILVVQRKVKPLESINDLPSHIPNFFTDLKLSNYGWLDGEFVAIDYGLTLLDHVGLNKAKLVKVNKKNWRDY